MVACRLPPGGNAEHVTLDFLLQRNLRIRRNSRHPAADHVSCCGRQPRSGLNGHQDRFPLRTTDGRDLHGAAGKFSRCRPGEQGVSTAQVPLRPKTSIPSVGGTLHRFYHAARLYP